MNNNPVDTKQVIDMYVNENLSMVEIGRRTGHPHGVIAYHLYKNKIPIRKVRLRYPNITTDYIKNLYEQGMSTVEIGEKTNLTPQSIWQRLIKANVKMRDQKEAQRVSREKGRQETKKGEESPCWKGGRYVDKNGYVVIRVDQKECLEHRVVWEKANGKIPDGFVLHHLNGIKTDNRLENLLCIPRSEHNPRKIIEPYQKKIKQLELEIYQLQKEIKEVK